MPPAYDVYNEQLRTLRRGHALYCPEPRLENGPVEVGDVGWIREGAFSRLFNIAWTEDDPRQPNGVPKHFRPFSLDPIQTFPATLKPGPLLCDSMLGFTSDVRAASAVMSADMSFQFSFSSSRGAVLMLETEMDRELVVHGDALKAYVLQNCHSWHSFAQEKADLAFGDLLLVTECSKTAGWASAVYSQAAIRPLKMSYAADEGFQFLPDAGAAAGAVHEHTGPVECRRSSRRPLDVAPDAVKDQTVFIRGYRLGFRSLYPRSAAYKFMKIRKGQKGGLERFLRRCTPNWKKRRSATMLEVVDDLDRIADFHPTVPLLAHLMETTNDEVVVVHDDLWCSTLTSGRDETDRLIDEYVAYIFHEVPPSTVHASPDDDPSGASGSSRLALNSVFNMLVKLRSRRKGGAQTSLGVIESSSGPATSHPGIGEVADSDKKDHFALAMTAVCSGGVDATLLLKKSRSYLLDQAKLSGANALADERWSVGIRQLKGQPRQGNVFRVEIAYSAVPVCVDTPDPRQPVALEKARSVPGLMAILDVTYS